eukprot:CAMPEP_0174351074 /NCGR_PEP_ID=MMETSP0811_2-20130205/8309_1 /TAXON_ID=73025 ORGANISM="Eutreptiella gymnastica-like, Strain CCMP1594" /NCGR_SAMPLE_ID=MMETSP0811_2 /ASSEMBLY_ACC=CAM_ASM_000667 /LENGTH=95 /DNA_ID=CAMNT_0015479939 /DNA_START=24 /DNA_END=307 /DNA_ORIENTATION=-
MRNPHGAPPADPPRPQADGHNEDKRAPPPAQSRRVVTTRISTSLAPLRGYRGEVTRPTAFVPGGDRCRLTHRWAIPRRRVLPSGGGPSAPGCTKG